MKNTLFYQTLPSFATCSWRTTSWADCLNSFKLSLGSGTCESRFSFSTSSSSSVCPIISNTGLKHATPDNFVAVVGSGKFLALWPLRGRSFIVFVNLGKIPLQFWHVYDKQVIKSSQLLKSLSILMRVNMTQLPGNLVTTTSAWTPLATCWACCPTLPTSGWSTTWSRPSPTISSLATHSSPYCKFGRWSCVVFMMITVVKIYSWSRFSIFWTDTFMAIKKC